MTTPSLSPREFEQLSAYLDGQLSESERVAVQRDLAERFDLRQVLEELRQTRAMLRNTPRRKVPHNFTLKAEQVPARRRVFSRPVFSLGLASALATFFLVLSVMVEFVPLPSFGASAPMAPQTMDSGEQRNMAVQSPQPTSAPEMSKAGGGVTATPAPTQALKVPESTRMVAQPVTGLTPTPIDKIRTTGDAQLQSTYPPPAPTAGPAGTPLPPAGYQPSAESTEPVLLGAQSTETPPPQSDEVPVLRSEPRSTLTWLQTLLVVLAIGTGLAALYLRKKP